MHALSHLYTITSRILDAGKNAYGELFIACDELYSTLLQLSGIDAAEDSNRQNLSMDHGNAIGLTWAAMCIKDMMRTKRFMDAIAQAANDAVQQSKGNIVRILYAGTGPFATLVLPLISSFTHQQIQFTLIEANENSFNCLQKLVSTLGLEKYIHRLEQADATKWKLPADEPFDIFICETMQQALKTEPQVAICMNIVPQLPIHTIMIPEQITLSAALLDPKKRMAEKIEGKCEGRAVEQLETVFIFNKETILRSAEDYGQAGDRSYYFPAKSIDIPLSTATTHPVLYVLTDITIYKNERLRMDECALTMPLKIQELIPPYPNQIEFHYQTGRNPLLRSNILSH